MTGPAIGQNFSSKKTKPDSKMLQYTVFRLNVQPINAMPSTQLVYISGEKNITVSGDIPQTSLPKITETPLTPPVQKLLGNLKK